MDFLDIPMTSIGKEGMNLRSSGGSQKKAETGIKNAWSSSQEHGALVSFGNPAILGTIP